MAAVDRAIAMGVADPDRLGVGGWSYGGILTDYVITKTGRFKAATSGASEVNYLANYGTDHYQKEWEAELGLPWKNAELWMRISPFFQVEKVTTPTLILGGADDVNVPLLNSEQLYQALRRLGRETELVIYPGQSHGITKPSYQKDRYRALPRLVRQVPEAGRNERGRRHRKPGFDVQRVLRLPRAALQHHAGSALPLLQRPPPRGVTTTSCSASGSARASSRSPARWAPARPPLCRALLEELGPSYNTALILNPCLTSDAAPAHHPDRARARARQADRVACLEVLNQFLLEQLARGNDVVLLIDEAQDLDSELLEQIRLLSNLETDQRKLLQIVLARPARAAGQAQRPRPAPAPPADHRPLPSDAAVAPEIERYIQHRLQVAGGQRPADLHALGDPRGSSATRAACRGWSTPSATRRCSAAS